MKTIYIVITICVFTVFVVYGVDYIKKSRDEAINIDMSQKDQIINASIDKNIILTLPNPGSGGYNFEDPIYDNTIIKEVSHTHKDPGDKNMVGNFGEDIWTFETIKKGRTDLTINISRPWENGESENYYNITILVN